MGRLFSSPRARANLAILKLLAAPIGLGIVIFAVLRDSPDLARGVEPVWLLLSAIAIQSALWVISMRLSQLLAIYRRRVPVAAALRINLKSTFYFLVVPTQAAMEAVRFLELKSASGASAAQIATTLVMDRLLGALSAAIVAAVAAALVFKEYVGPESVELQFGALAAIGLCAIATIVAGHFLLRWRPTLIVEIRNALSPLREAPLRLAGILLLAVASQALVIVSVACALRAVGLAVPLPTLALAIMGGTVLMLIPVSVGGIGPAEVGSAALLIAFGIDEPVALVAVFLTYLTRVFAGLQGAALEFWAGGKTLAELANKTPKAGSH